MNRNNAKANIPPVSVDGINYPSVDERGATNPRLWFMIDYLHEFMKNASEEDIHRLKDIAVHYELEHEEVMKQDDYESKTNRKTFEDLYKSTRMVLNFVTFAKEFRKNDG